jgi:hypothetical protein
LPDFLIPQCRPAAEKPFGEVIVLFFVDIAINVNLTEGQNRFKRIRRHPFAAEALFARL